MDKRQQLILDRSSTYDLKRRLKTLDSVYHITEDRQMRQNMLLFMDELKLEIAKRGTNDKSICRY
jgi:hypothetical protein